MLSSYTEKTKTHILRLKPDEDLEKTLLDYCKEHNIKAAYIPVLQGGLKNCKLIAMKRADGNSGTDSTTHTGERENDDKPDSTEIEIYEPLEFFGQGIICPDEKGNLTLHIHLNGAKSDHTTTGGHLVKGKIVFHAECILVEMNGLDITRKPDTDVFNYPLIHFGE